MNEYGMFVEEMEMRAKFWAMHNREAVLLRPTRLSQCIRDVLGIQRRVVIFK